MISYSTFANALQQVGRKPNASQKIAVETADNFYVLELKLSRGPDSALGQILRYMGWIREHLAGGKSVKGVIIAAEMSDKLRYAVSCVPDVKLLTYKLRFDVEDVPVIGI